MAQLEFRLDIPWAGGLLLVGQKAHDMPLGSGQIHGFQRVGHGLVGAPVQDPDQMSVMVSQKDHLPNKKCSVLPNILAEDAPICKGFGKSLQIKLKARQKYRPAQTVHTNVRGEKT